MRGSFGPGRLEQTIVPVSTVRPLHEGRARRAMGALAI